MRYRLTVSDAATGVTSDVVVECDPADPVGAVLQLVADALPVSGVPLVGGLPVDLSTSVATSPLREGAVLSYGGPDNAGPDAYAAAPAAAGLRLRVVSGPSAGARVDLRPGTILEIGRGAHCGLVLADHDVSRSHASVRGVGHGFVVGDLGSANGTFVSADGTFATSSRITADQPLADGAVVQVGASRILLEDAGRAAAAITRAPDGAYQLNRTFPDRRRPFAAPTVTLPTPLPEDDARGIPLLAMFLPLVLACAMALFLKSPMYLLFGLLTPILMGGNWWSDRRRRIARDARQQGSYTDKLAAARTRIDQSADDEDADLRARMPDPVSVSRTALELRRELWSRRPGEDGWLTLRLGSADLPASVVVTGEQPVGWEDAVLRGAPVGVELDEVGVLGIAGTPAWQGDRLAWVVTQLAVHHSADELQIVVLAPDETRGDGDAWLRWLPHCRTATGDVVAAWDDANVDLLVRELGATVDQRRADLANRHTRPVGGIVVLLFGAGRLAARPAVAELLSQGPDLGLRFVCVDDDERLLPDTCRAVFVETTGGAMLRLDKGAATVVVPDALPTGTADRIARTLAPLRRVGDTPTGTIPASVRFTDIVPVPTVDELRASWRLAPESTDVTVGQDRDGRFRLDIAAHGPHAVVAGTSGAGKSELLQTWIGALALANSPEQLSVVFVDFKGGAAFLDLVALPHVVGSVTNLNTRLAARALSSLRAELTRRQHQLAAVGAGDRSDYQRRAALDPGLPPFPRLLIVVDELAELKEELPDLVDGLVGVARIGRSLGVHLVLATQKPAGVVDAQIRANVDLRICLRTRDEGESVDVIETGDAARIPKDRPGRALVVRGGSTATSVQTARITTITGSGAADRRAAVVHWTSPSAPPAPSTTEGLRTDLHAIVDAVVAAADADGRAAPYLPWTEPLPTILTLDDLPAVAGHLVLGLCDIPHEQRRSVLAIPLGTGHVAIAGSGRTGRTTAIRAVAAALARSAPPDQVHIHIVDGAGGLAGLAALPHVGVIADDDDPERLERLLQRLVDEVRGRRRMLAERGAASTAELGSDAPPAVVLLVDNWAGPFEADGAPQALLNELLSGGSVAAGVTVVLTGDERMLRGRLLNRIDHRFSLRLNNPTDGTVIGLDVRNLPTDLPAGRMLSAADGTETQVPLLVADPSGPAQAAALATLAADLRARSGETPVERAPMRLDPLPARIALGDALELPELVPGRVLLGVSGDRLSRVGADLGDATRAVLVAGPARSGRSTAAAAIAASAALSGSRVLLVAPRPADPHKAAAAAGAQLVAPADLGAALAELTPDVVVVDDADTAVVADECVDAIAAHGGPALVVAAQLDSFTFGTKGLLGVARKSRGSVVLLSPPNHLAAGNVGVTLERGSGFSGPPGRAYLVVDGSLFLGQVADPA